MNKKGLFIIALFLFASMAFTTTTQTVAQENEVIVIGTDNAGNQYNRTSIPLEKGVTYTIIFVNTQTQGHNLRIDDDGDVSSNTLSDSDDTLIGPENDASYSNPEPTSYNVTWTAPNEDIDIVYYCGYTGHYPDMQGTFVVGEGSPTEDTPGMGLFIALSTVLAVAVVVPHLRKD